jgi:hypothetical protein
MGAIYTVEIATYSNLSAAEIDSESDEDEMGGDN